MKLSLRLSGYNKPGVDIPGCFTVSWWQKKCSFSEEIVKEEYLKCLLGLILFLGKCISGKTTFQKLRCKDFNFWSWREKLSKESFYVLRAWFIRCLTACLTVLIIKHVVVNSGFFTLATKPSQGSVAPFKLPVINVILPKSVNVNSIFYTFIIYNLNSSLDMTKHFYSIDKLNPKVTNMGFKEEVVESICFDYSRIIVEKYM